MWHQSDINNSTRREIYLNILLSQGFRLKRGRMEAQYFSFYQLFDVVFPSCCWSWPLWILCVFLWISRNSVLQLQGNMHSRPKKMAVPSTVLCLRLCSAHMSKKYCWVNEWIYKSIHHLVVHFEILYFYICLLIFIPVKGSI